MQGDTLRLLFPQWQGSSAAEPRRLFEGAQQLRDLLPGLEFQTVTVDTEPLGPTEDDVAGKTQLLTQAQQTRSILEKAQPARVVTLGGDCGVDLVPASYLNSIYDNLAIIWIDAHADLNTPASSPSKTFHGMVLRTLLGEGDPALTDLAFSRLESRQIFLAGARAFDPPEVAHFEENRLSLFKPGDLETRPEQFIELVAMRGFTHLHLHLDLDVLDPASFTSTGYPTPDGLTLEGLSRLLRALTSAFDVVGFTLTEYMPRGNEDLGVLRRLLEAAPLLEP